MDETLPQEDSNTTTTTRNDDSENQLRQQEQNADLEQQAKSQQQLEQQQKLSSSEQQQQLQQHDSNEQQQQENHQRQQQTPPEALQSSSSSSSSTIGSNILTNLRTNANTNLTKSDTSIPEELFSNKRWGTTPIRQDTPWELPPSPTQTQPSGAGSMPHQQPVGLGAGGSSLAIPPGISQSGDSFHGQAMAATVNNMGGLVGGPTNMLSSRFEQPWRGSMAPSKPPTLATSASFANHNLMSAAPGAMPKSYLGSSGNGQSAFSMQPGGDFARAPGPSPSILDASAMVQKPFGMAQRASTWSSFGSQAGPNDNDSEWPKTTVSGGISAAVNSNQSPSNAFDLVHDMEPGKSWHGSNLMKGLEDDSPMNLGQASMSGAFQSAYGFSSASKSPPTGGQFGEPSGIGTWSPVVKGNRSGSMWGGDGDDGGRGEGGRFDDGTAIWGATSQPKVSGGVDWVEKSGDPNSNNDKSRSSAMAGNNQSNYRPQQQQSSSSSTSLLMSSNTSPSSQQNRNQQQQQQQNFNKPSSLSHNFDQVQQQSNALSSQANQPNRGLGLSSNVPSKHQQQLTTMVQQIQLAVQAGHLNPQILNQPLAPVTLQLLYQLLQQIRTLHQLQMKFNQPGSNQAGVGVQMTKTKQNILNLQNQIAAQQAMHLKQNQAHNISSRQPTMPNLATGGMGGNIGPTLPPGISQSGDSFRSGTSVGDFHGQAMVNSFGADSMGANGLATSLSHMNLGGGSGAGGVMHSRFDQPWRQAPTNKHHQSSMGSSSSFANHNLMNAAPGGMQKSMLNNSTGNGAPSYIGMQQGGEFARAPGPASSMMDNSLNPKPFGMTNRNASSTWSAFGNSSSNEPEPEWPKSATTSSGISSNNSSQPPNAFDLVPEFEPGKPWRGSMLMRSVEDDPTMTPGSMARSLAPQRKTIWSDEIL